MPRIQDATPSLLEQVAAEPALVQLVLLAFVGLGTWFALGRLARSVRAARGRAATRDFLLGVEQAMQGDAKGAANRLQRVLVDDPENATARLVYAEVLTELGEPGEAHKHHVQLERGFGLRSRRHLVARAASLLDADRAADAIEPAKAAALARPGDPEPLRLLLRAQVAAGQPADAGETARRLALVLPSGAERDAVRAQGARSLALAARVRLGAGDHAGARDLVARAARLGGPAAETQRVAAGIRLLGTGDAALVTGDDPALPALRSDDRAALAHLVPAGPFRCRACDGPVDEAEPSCPHCGARGTLEPTEPDLLRELESPVWVVDAIEENRAHVQRLLLRITGGDLEAADEVVAIGEGAVEETLARAVENGPDDAVFTPLLQRMGPACLAALFEAYRRRKDDWLARFGEMLGRQSSATVVGRVVQSFGRAALPEFEPLLDSADRDLRKVLIDFYVGLADQVEFEKVLERYPPLEVVRRLEQAPSPVLQRFVASVEAGSFQAEVLLTDASFTREADLFEAIEGPGESVLEEVLQRRGYSRGLTRTLIQALPDSARGPVAERLLDVYGDRALDAQVATFADLDAPAAVRERLATRLAAAGERVVARLCDCLGARPSQLDAEVTRVFVAIGEPAVAPLAEAYRQGGMLEKFAPSLVRRHGHRRQLIVRTLADIGGALVERAIAALRGEETDTNLKLRLDQALHRVRDVGAANGEEDHGQVG